MLADLGLEVVKNKKTGQAFVFVENKAGINILVIGPDGKDLEVPSVIFEEKQRLTSVEMQSVLTEAQIKAINTRKPKRAKSSSTGTRTASTTRRKKAEKKGTKVGLGAEWNSSVLTFYKHKIEPLDPKQWFIVTVDGYGKVRMTKEEFSSEFMDVILLEDYWRNGSYSYSVFPEKAKKFILAEG